MPTLHILGLHGYFDIVAFFDKELPAMYLRKSFMEKYDGQNKNRKVTGRHNYSNLFITD